MNVLPSESKEKKETTSLTTSAKESSKCYNLRTTSIYLLEDLKLEVVKLLVALPR